MDVKSNYNGFVIDSLLLTLNHTPLVSLRGSVTEYSRVPGDKDAQYLS